MQTQNIVQASANVIRITNLLQGDLYKRFEHSEYSKDTHYGIVKGLYNDGEKTFIECVEYKKNYNGIEAQIYVIRGDKDVAIFPISLDELKEEFSSAEIKIVKQIEDKEKELTNLKGVLKITQELIDGTLQKKLQTPIFKEMTQKEYNQKLIERQKAIEAVSSDN